MSRFKIIVGHFGSGKTEVAINITKNLISEAPSKKAAIIDLDTVNPYFRTADAAEFLRQMGVSVILPLFANTNVDIPALPAAINSVFADRDITAVFDVGGDDDGAIALGRYSQYFRQEPYEMLFVVNAMRPLTKTQSDVIEMMNNIEDASRLKITHLVNNTHLSGETVPDIILQGQSLCEEVSKKTGVPIAFTSAKKDLAGELTSKIKNPVLGLDLYINLPFGS